MTIPTKNGVININSLKDKAIVDSLMRLLIYSWDNVLISDTNINMKDKKIKYKHRRVLFNGINPKYWEQLKEKNKREFNYQRNLFKKLLVKYGCNLHNQIKELIKTEWERLANNCTNLPVVNTDNVSKFTECGI
jgi:hypothetical protein